MILLRIEILHDFVDQNPRDYGSMVHIGPCRIHIINSLAPSRAHDCVRSSIERLMTWFEKVGRKGNPAKY